jgi:hypothetical protein
LPLHAGKTCVDVAGPLRVAVTLRSQIVIAIKRPDAQAGITALALVEHSAHVEELEIVEGEFAAIREPGRIGLIVPPTGDARIEGRLKMFPEPGPDLRL